MNIPLNIDWQQILLHLLNFSVLTLGLYLLLYNPVRNFMAQRAEHYQNLQSQTQQKLEQAEGLEASYNQRLQDIDTAIEQKKALAEQETRQAADALLQDAKEQAAKLMADAQAAAQKERAQILEDSRQEIARMAVAATEKLLAQSASGALDQFLAAAKKE